MSSALAEREERSALARRLGMSNSQLELIRRMAVHPEAPDDVVELYLAKCRAVGVDPLDRLIYVIPRRQNVQNQKTGVWQSELRWTIQGSIDLFRSIAEDSNDYAGQLGPYWTADGKEWSDVWIGKTPPVACKVGVLRRSFDEPLWVTGTFEYYAPRDNKGNLVSNFWKGEKGAHQLAKCVEELALRKAFPRKLHGVYGSEEMEQAGKPETPRKRELPPEDVTDAQFEALPSGDSDEQCAKPTDNPVDMSGVAGRPAPAQKPEEYRRKAGIGAIHALCRSRDVSDALYRSTLLEMFDAERFTDKETGEVYPTSKVLTVPELERVWLTLNDRTKAES